MNIGLFFGSFNPIHTGHCIIANFVSANAALDQVWLVVSPQNPLKPSNSLLNEYHRLHLAKLAVANESHLKVSDIEFHLPKPSYTIDTLTNLQLKYPQHRFSVIMGSDSYENLPNWKNYEMILKHYAVIVYMRPGFEEPKTLPANVTVLKAPMLEISATHIRETIRRNQSISFLVPDPVKEEIIRNGYYR